MRNRHYLPNHFYTNKLLYLNYAVFIYFKLKCHYGTCNSQKIQNVLAWNILNCAGPNPYISKQWVNRNNDVLLPVFNNSFTAMKTIDLKNVYKIPSLVVVYHCVTFENILIVAFIDMGLYRLGRSAVCFFRFIVRVLSRNVFFCSIRFIGIRVLMRSVIVMLLWYCNFQFVGWECISTIIKCIVIYRLTFLWFEWIGYYMFWQFISLMCFSLFKLISWISHMVSILHPPFLIVLYLRCSNVSHP